MKYDFTTILDRRGHDAIAVDAVYSGNHGYTKPRDEFDVIPMWVADMNYPTCPSILDAVKERLEHPSFGYYSTRPEYYESIIRWHTERNHVQNLTADCIGYENGVLGGVASAIWAFASPGDNILVHSPTYIGFTYSIEGSGYRLIHSALKKDADGIWRMDYEDMDRKIKENNIHVAVFCNPHNPCGRVWEQEELEQAMDVYRKNDCVVICDEIWSDIILDGHHHIPLQSVNEDARNRVVALYSLGKTFSLAGFVCSYHIIYNKYLRDRVVAAGDKCHYNSQNVLSMYAVIGAYKPEGMEWVDELCHVLTENVDFACQHILNHYEGITLSKPQGTYMLYLDCTGWCEKSGKTVDDLLKAGWEVGVVWQDGRPFHGDNTIRMNLALPLSRVQEAFCRLDKYVFSI